MDTKTKRVIPIDQISIDFEYWVLWRTSGAIYLSVPHGRSGNDLGQESLYLTLIPKSISFTSVKLSDEVVIILSRKSNYGPRLPGFTTRWTIPFWWR